MNIEFVRSATLTGDSVVIAVTVFEGGQLSREAAALDKRMSGDVARAVALGRAKGKLGETLEILVPHGIGVGRVLIAGAGKEESWSSRQAEQVAARAYNATKSSGARVLLLELPLDTSANAAHAAFATKLASYRFNKYRTSEKQDDKPSVEATKIVTMDPQAAAAEFKRLDTLANAICFARDLVSEPSNVLYPEEFAARVQKLSSLGLEVAILGEAEMAKLGMGALLGVGQGSVHESKLAIIQWKGASDPSSPPVAFVGKGVCFDTGGISLKPWERMEEMVFDMGGAAAVAGALYALSARKAKVNAVGILGLVENMPDGKAQRPGDVVKTMSGQTVEVINTDAEGRLVLADALWYCQSRFKPRFMIDLATLTGAIVTALGTDMGGLYCTDSALAGNLLAAAEASDDQLWRMPLPPQYEKLLKSRLADMKNVGDRTAGSITAALFIQKFANGVPWAHIDMAGTVFQAKSNVPTIPNGATGYGVRLLDQLIASFYEN